MNLFHMLFGKSSSDKKTRKTRYHESKHNKSYKKGQFKHGKSRRNKHRMKGG